MPIGIRRGGRGEGVRWQGGDQPNREMQGFYERKLTRAYGEVGHDDLNTFQASQTE